jgi:DNA repair protein RadD
MGRGTRIAEGKTDCLVLDFTDTVERLGPVDAIKGRAKRATGPQEAPYSICPGCGERNAPAALVCVFCGETIREEVQAPKDAKVSYAALLSAQREQEVTWHDISRVEYKLHRKEGKPDSVRVDYYDGFMRVASEWVCFNHTGYARQKAESWWLKREPVHYPTSVERILNWLQDYQIIEPIQIATRQNGKFTEITHYEFNRTKRNQESLETTATET